MLFFLFLGIRFIAKSSAVSQGADYAQNKALQYNKNHVDIYACAWGPDGIFGNNVGYNLAPEALKNGTKNVSIKYVRSYNVVHVVIH